MNALGGLVTRDKDAEYTEFFNATGPRLRRVAYLITGDWQVAEDVTQQGMAKVYVNWSKSDSIRRDAYARRIVVNEALGYLRRSRRRGIEVPLEVAPDPHHHDEQHHLGDALVIALQELPKQQRAVVALRVLDDLSVREVSEILGIAEGTVKSQYHRAMGTLRKGHARSMSYTNMGEE